MKPVHLFVAAFAMLGFMGLSFNWDGDDRPLLVEVLGAIGTFAWLPLLVVAGVWSYRSSRRRL